MRLYLASTSPARLALLRQVGIEPVVVPSHVDEEAAVRLATDSNGELDASAMVTLLARLKAEAILGQRPDGEEIDGVILGGDSAFELGGDIYGKPHEPQIARERWLEQRGKTGTLHSGHWIIEVKNGQAARALGATAHASVEFASDISDSEIDAYVAERVEPEFGRVERDVPAFSCHVNIQPSGASAHSIDHAACQAATAE